MHWRSAITAACTERLNSLTPAGNDIKPIVGIEAYMAPKSRHDRELVDGESAYHLLLLAQNREGYQNLIKLSSLSYREGFYYKARIDKEILKEYSAGIIATSPASVGKSRRSL